MFPSRVRKTGRAPCRVHQTTRVQLSLRASDREQRHAGGPGLLPRVQPNMKIDLIWAMKFTTQNYRSNMKAPVI